MPNGQEQPTTRADVARLAGVSTAVVSYVVNNGPRGVSPATREKVLRAIRQLNYRPNASARALKTGNTGMIGLVVSEVANPHYAELIEAIDSAAGATGRTLMLGISHGTSSGEDDMIHDLIDHGLDGLILINCRLTDDRLRRIGAVDKPCILIDRAMSGSMLPTVNADLAAGAQLAVEHLADHGHRHIVHVTGPLLDTQIDHRSAAYERVLRERGLPLTPPVVADWTRDGGYKAALRLLSKPDRPTAIFAASDLVAIGILKAAHDLDISIPSDLAIVSLDGTADAAYIAPGLTTVRQPLDLMAKEALNMLTSADAHAQQTIFPVELVVRDSCGHHP